MLHHILPSLLKQKTMKRFRHSSVSSWPKAETPLTLISVSLFVLFPGCIVCCSPCCSIILIYVLSLLCLSFHTFPSEIPRSTPSVSYLSQFFKFSFFFLSPLFSFKNATRLKSLVSTRVLDSNEIKLATFFRRLLFKTHLSLSPKNHSS